MLELVNLGKSFGGVDAIRDISLTVGEDEYVTLLGPSGSGKTTLLRAIAGLDRPDSGSVFLYGEDVTETPPHLRGLGFVQQKYALFPHMSVLENVSFGLKNHHSNPVLDDKEIMRRCGEILEIVGLNGFESRGVGQISGGQKQRVSLARTLVTRPKICLLDEPLGALDANLRERMTVELRDIRASLGVSFMHVTGNEDEALGMGDRMIVLDAGKAIQVNTPGAIFRRPSTVTAAKNVNNYNILPGAFSENDFVFEGQKIGLPDGIVDAAFYAIGIDRVSVGGKAVNNDKTTSIPATYVATEFMGSRVLYLFQRQDGKVFEVERHLSREMPIEYTPGNIMHLSWEIDDVLAYAQDGTLLSQTKEIRGAA